MDGQLAYLIHILVGFTLLAIFWKQYKLKLKFDHIAIMFGFIIAIAWLLTYNIFPLFSISFQPDNLFFLIMKLLGFLFLAPLVEELFTRSFLARALIAHDWKKIPIGKYTLPSFIITVLFFGFSHGAWISGLISGIVLNLLLYKQKSIESCILAHFTANLLLAIFIIATGTWSLW
jgi:hypothetical protein